MPAMRIAEVVFTDPDTMREVIHNFNRDGFEALYSRYRGGRREESSGRHEAPPAYPTVALARWSLHLRALAHECAHFA